ncbi:MAG: HEAT repeat domain-containing protein [Candidatus Omnitrophota bacterium]
MKKTFLKFIIGISIAICIIFSYYLGSFLYWHLAAWSAISITNELEKKFNTWPSDKLIRRVNALDPFSPVPLICVEILAERKDKKAIPRLIKKLNSISPDLQKSSIYALGKIEDSRAIEPLISIFTRYTSELKYQKEQYDGIRYALFYALGQLNDPRTIVPLMKIVKQGRGHLDYVDALQTLSKKQYKEITPYVVDWAKQDDSLQNGSLTMLEELGDPDLLPLAVDMRKKIKQDSSANSKLDRFFLEKAIAHLESIQKEQEQQNKEKSPFTPIN